MLTFGSLFAGIGGLDLGFERAGMHCRWQVEIDPFCQRVLAKHWPDVGRWDDVATFPPAPAEDWSVDVICGGFPCQDISNAGKKAGIEGERSGLWAEFARIIRVLQPRIVVVENVSALLGRGMDRILGDLAASGFDVEWFVLPAASVGATHIRERVFVVAHSDCQFWGAWWEGRFTGATPWLLVPGEPRESSNEATTGIGNWATEPGLVRLVHGVPPFMDRLRGSGNAVVPQVAEWIGLKLMENCA